MSFLDEPQARNTFDAARELVHLMISRATDTAKINRRAFIDARRAVLSDPGAAKLAPECVRFCREPDEVWTYVKAQDRLDTYASRRLFFRQEFEPLLSALERFESSPLDDLVSTGTRDLDSASVSAAWTKAIERRTSDPEGAITAARAAGVDLQDDP